METIIWLRVSEAAKKMQVSEGLIYKMVRIGALPCYRLGRSIRIRPDDIEKLKEAARG